MREDTEKPIKCTSSRFALLSLCLFVVAIFLIWNRPASLKPEQRNDTQSFVNVTNEWQRNVESLLSKVRRHYFKTAFLDSVKLAKNAAPTYWAPYECTFDEPRRSVYMNYGLKVMNERNRWEEKDARGVVWAYRGAIYQVQLALFRTLGVYCPDIRNQMLPLKAENTTRFDLTVNCYNPINVEFEYMKILMEKSATTTCLKNLINKNEYRLLEDALKGVADFLKNHLSVTPKQYYNSSIYSALNLQH